MLNRCESTSSKARLREFANSIVGKDLSQVEEDFGCGYVRLCASEAQRRQAAQDIRSPEDALLELLRNSRDAGSKNIFVATHRDGDTRRLTVIDDGCGIPPVMHKKVFLPRVTSKLDTASFDKWGMHGRGMALYSISENSLDANIVFSDIDKGTSVTSSFDTNTISEKRDQSTFPHFEKTDDTYIMRGPKNLLRIAAEFAIEHENTISLFIGSDTEIASSIYAFGINSTTISQRAFKDIPPSSKALLYPAYADDSDELAYELSKIGLNISKRSARRIMDGEILPLCPIADRVKNDSFNFNSNLYDEIPTSNNLNKTNKCTASTVSQQYLSQKRILKDDINDIAEALNKSYSSIAKKYYLRDEPCTVKQVSGKLVFEILMVDEDL